MGNTNNANNNTAKPVSTLTKVIDNLINMQTDIHHKSLTCLDGCLDQLQLNLILIWNGRALKLGPKEVKFVYDNKIYVEGVTKDRYVGLEAKDLQRFTEIDKAEIWKEVKVKHKM